MVIISFIDMLLSPFKPVDAIDLRRRTEISRSGSPLRERRARRDHVALRRIPIARRSVRRRTS
jgi:hypothetical protein